MSERFAEPIQSAVEPDLRGRWTITALNGKPQSGMWLELGEEGLPTITTQRNAVFIRSPRPATRAFLGCNDWDPTGWSRQDGNLILAREMSRRTERGCDAEREAFDDEAYAILIQPMTVTFTLPNRLGLANEYGALDLVRETSGE